MEEENSRTGPPAAPTGGELEVLAVLWRLGNQEALRLGEVHERLCARRRASGEPEPALTTVSSVLRNGVVRRIFREVRVTSDGVEDVNRNVSRSALVSSRSGPKVSYQAVHGPSESLSSLLLALAEAYPADQRHKAVLDMAVAAGIEQRVIDRIATITKPK